MKKITNMLMKSAAAVCMMVATLIGGSPGSLDLSFSGDGKLTDLVPGTYEENSFIATSVQPDGKIVAVGNVWNAPRYVYAARYNVDGSPDASFGSGSGKVAVQFGGFYNYATDVALQPDGRIIISGCYCEENFGDYTLALARLNSDGSLDTTFGDSGRLLRPDLVGPANSIAIQPDGKIVVAGQAGFYLDWLVIRFNADGSQDTAFNVLSNIFSPEHGVPRAVAVQADGKVIAVGSDRYTGVGTYNFVVVRYNPDGSLDPTFDGDGIATTHHFHQVASSVAIQSDGKIVAAGGSFMVVRYNTDGSLDTTFDGDGIVTTSIGTFSRAGSIAIQPDGKIVAAGQSSNGEVKADFTVVRYLTDGSLDTSFSGDGVATVDFSSGNDMAYSMALDNAGRAVLAGESEGYFAMARLLLVPDVSISGRVTTPSGLGLRNAVVALTDSKGNKRSVLTSTLGFYSLNDIAVGETVTIAVSSKRYRFQSLTRTVNDSLSNLDFVGIE